MGAVLLLLALLLSLLYEVEPRPRGGQGGADSPAVGSSAGNGDGTGNSSTDGTADQGRLDGSGAGDVLSDQPTEVPGGIDEGQDATTTPQGDADPVGGPPASRIELPDQDAVDPDNAPQTADPALPPPGRLGFQSDLLAAPPAVTPGPPGPVTTQQAGSATPGLASFFGQTGRGSRFVFIIDRSGSMRGERFDAARFELIKSIRSLGEHESFFVIFYDSEAELMPASGLLAATAGAQQRIIDWIREVSVGGGTDPTEALIHALNRLRPDTIWLLSDGAFSAAVGETVKRLNPNAKVQINTIAFHNRGGETLLRIIADENDGDYQYVGP